MKTFYLILVLLFVSTQILFGQAKIENDIDAALVNAKKGVYWALSNISSKKARLDKSLINDDQLIARVKLVKELNGVRIESTGYFQTNEVTVVIYRSKDSLIKDGFIKKGDIETYDEEE
jgi:hypothetical protein